MSENLADVKKSDLTTDSEMLDMDLCTDGKDNWVVRVQEDHFLNKDGSVIEVESEVIPENAVYSTVIKAQQVAQRQGENLEFETSDEADEEDDTKEVMSEADGSVDDGMDRKQDESQREDGQSEDDGVFDVKDDSVDSETDDSDEQTDPVFSDNLEDTSDEDSGFMDGSVFGREDDKEDEKEDSDEIGLNDESDVEQDKESVDQEDGGFVQSVRSFIDGDSEDEAEKADMGEELNAEQDEDSSDQEDGGFVQSVKSFIDGESKEESEEADKREVSDIEEDSQPDEEEESEGVIQSMMSVFNGNSGDDTDDDIKEDIEHNINNSVEEDADESERADISPNHNTEVDNEHSASEEDSVETESEDTDEMQTVEKDDESGSLSFRKFLSPRIEDVNQERPDARNVSIDFIQSGSGDGFWSDTMSTFWDKLRRARNGETEAVKDINSDLWTRYKALIKYNEHARGDVLDTFVGIFLIILGTLAVAAGFLSLFVGDVASLDVLTQESGYADHIFITTVLLFMTGLSFWLSRRTNSETIVSAIKKPARALEFTVVLAQITVIAVVMYMLTLGGGQEGLALMEQSTTETVISVISNLPSSVSEPAISGIESYRGPESVTGFSIVESSMLMTIVGFLIAYPVLKRSVARFVLTANMGAREFREVTGILVEEISEGSESTFDEPEYVLGGSDVEGDNKPVTEQRVTPDMDDNEVADGLIALPDHIKGSPFAEYEEHQRYWVRAPYAYVSIVYNERRNDYRYVVVEPELDETEEILFDEIKTRLDNVLLFEDVEEFENHEKEVEAKLEKLEKRMIELTEEYNIDVNDETFHRLMYFIERDYVYYNKIDPFINDPYVEDISCDGEDQYIFIFHSEHKDVISNVKFGKQELRSFIQELAQRSGEHISAADPMVDASLPDGSRAQMTLGTEVTTHGSTFTIRLFEDIPFTPVDLLDYDTFSITQMAYLWTAIQHNKSLIFAGGTASGKTTSMNAVSMFIPPKAKVITIEDTREISLPQKNWVPGTTREGVSGEEGGDDIDMYELLRAALRQRPEYIVVGEIRGEEAQTLFQAMNTGHTTYSTMHAETVDAAIGRLTNPPISVPKQMLTALDIICIQNQIRFTDDEGNQINVRRNEETREIVSLRDNGQFENRRPFQWDAETDTFIESLEDSHVLERVANENGWTPEEKKQELNHRSEVLEYMLENDIREFEYVTNIIQSYMVDPEKILRQMRNDTLDPDNLSSLTDMEWDNPEVEPDETLNEKLQEQAPEAGDIQ